MYALMHNKIGICTCQEVYSSPKIYIRYGDLATAHVQNDVEMTKTILSRSLKPTHYDQNWLNIFIHGKNICMQLMFFAYRMLKYRYL